MSLCSNIDVYTVAKTDLTVTSRDTEENTIVLLKNGRVGEDLWYMSVFRSIENPIVNIFATHLVTSLLGRSVHLLEDFLGESLLDLPHVALDTGLLDTTSFSFGESLDVAIHGVLYSLIS